MAIFPGALAIFSGTPTAASSEIGRLAHSLPMLAIVPFVRGAESAVKRFDERDCGWASVRRHSFGSLRMAVVLGNIRRCVHRSYFQRFAVQIHG